MARSTSATPATRPSPTSMSRRSTSPARPGRASASSATATSSSAVGPARMSSSSTSCSRTGRCRTTCSRRSGRTSIRPSAARSTSTSWGTVSTTGSSSSATPCPSTAFRSRTHSMEVWIGLNSDTNPAEDITFNYANAQPGGEGGFGTIGAENKFGNRGAMIYADGTGSLPDPENDVRITTTPGTVHAATITYDAKAQGGGASRQVVAQLRDADQQRVPRDQLRLRQWDHRPLTSHPDHGFERPGTAGAFGFPGSPLNSRRCRSVVRAGRRHATGHPDPGPSGAGRRRAGSRPPRAGRGWRSCRRGRPPAASRIRPPPRPG